MMKRSRIPQYALAYAAWVLFILLFFYFVVLSRDTWLAFLRNYWAQENLSRQFAINFLDRIYTMLIGLTWLILMIVFESYLRNGVANGTNYHRTSLVVGITISLIFLTQFIRTLMIGLSNVSPLTIVILALQFLFGAGLLYISAKTPRKAKKVVNI